jgi:hypothetical protein
MTDTWIDGLGVRADEPLPDGTRIRFRIDPENPERDITVLVEKGRIHITGMNRPLIIEPVTATWVAVLTRDW